MMPDPAVKFFPGLHQPADAQHFDRCCMSINRLRGRSKPVQCEEVFVDSGAFIELERFGGYRHSVDQYGGEVRRLHENGVVKISVAVAQDYMCESWMLKKTGLTIPDHQRLTVERYDALMDFGLPVPVLPVLQGFAPDDYSRHVEAYGDRLSFGMWVGVGSVCKRQGDPRSIIAVLQAILRVRPDLRLHGFGVKKTALMHPGVREGFYSADSMAWSYAARKQGRDGNSWLEAKAFTDSVNAAASMKASAWQMEMF